ncbi:TIGR03905 family TSCPD domain-containing protein [Pectinatus frisingensis]|uniref:TIGR03905 family TSCPD domain-containing protein n=2 Tax=Pectinatus frisingensis TaxID=865 RepID=UPI0015F4850A|nr:TIGR03905 family TSCPD domain-containing protein [Pectinatus frisingensis]
MSMYSYKTAGTCSQQINIELNGNIIKNISFIGGCNGNLQGITKLVQGQDAHDIINNFSGIKCGSRQTSCPDQLAKALQEALNKR